MFRGQGDPLTAHVQPLEGLNTLPHQPPLTPHTYYGTGQDEHAPPSLPMVWPPTEAH